MGDGSLTATVEQEIRDLIVRHGRITFAQFMAVCLYSRNGGFYATRREGIDAHFGTAPMSHPAFGALLARQLADMWRLLGEPSTFHVVEPGSGDGALSRAIARAAAAMDGGFPQALCHVASDYAPRWLNRIDHPVPPDPDPRGGRLALIERVQTAGVDAFANIVGCILANELVDNFPVHRFAVERGRLREVFVTLSNGRLAEVLDEPSTPRLQAYLDRLGVTFDDGDRGEVCLAIDDWTAEAARALTRGFVLTIDYGEQAGELYPRGNRRGTLVCYHRHQAGDDPYRHLGEQDITCMVDFTSLMRAGTRHGLATLGYDTQRSVLGRLGFDALLADELRGQRSAAHAALAHMAMTSLVDPAQYGDFKVLVQGKGVREGSKLVGFEQCPPTAGP